MVADNKLHNSGALSPPNGKATFTFPKTGTFAFHCLLHPGMDGSVQVLPASAVIPGPAAVAASAARQIAKAWNLAKQVARVPSGVEADVIVGPTKSLAGGEATLIAFEPKTLTVPEGTTVTFASPTETEIHTVSFGPAAWYTSFDRKTSKNNGVDPIEIYGTDEVASTTGRVARLFDVADYTYDGTSHGNGVLSTPILNAAPGAPFGPAFSASTSVTFTKAGTYHYFCLIHGPGMSGNIVVTAASG